METTYIQFQAPPSSPDGAHKKHFIRNLATRALSKLIPLANPDFENKIDEVALWLVECDKESGIPQREIGLDKQGQAILKMPIGNNYGYWTDNNLLLDDFKDHFQVSEITGETFEQYWNSI